MDSSFLLGVGQEGDDEDGGEFLVCSAYFTYCVREKTNIFFGNIVLQVSPGWRGNVM
jgi:hypothetical protein